MHNCLTKTSKLLIPTKKEIWEIVKLLPKNSNLTQDQLFQLTFVFYLLITPSNLSTPTQILTFSMIAKNELIALLQRLCKIPNAAAYFCNHEDSVEKKAGCISGLMQAMSQACGGFAQLGFIAGSVIVALVGQGYLSLSVIPAAPWNFLGGEAAAGLSDVLAIPGAKKQDRFSGNPRLSLTAGAVRHWLGAGPGVLFGLVLGAAMPYPIGPISLGCAAVAQCIKMVFNGILYGEQPTQGFVKELKLVIKNVSNQEKAALAAMFLTVTKSLNQQDDPYALYFGAAAMACTTSIASVADSLSHIKLDKLLTRDNASNAISAVGSTLMSAINAMAIADAVAGSGMISPEIYSLCVAAGLTLEQVSNVLTTKINPKAKPIVTASGLLAVIMLIINSVEPGVMGTVTLYSLLFYFFIVLPMIQPGAPAKPAVGEAAPLLDPSSVNA